MAQRVSLSENQEDEPPLKTLKDRWWSYLCGYTHTGPQQIFSRLGSAGLSSNYERDQIVVALRWADLVQLYASLEIVLATESKPLAEKLLKRMTDYEGTPYEEA